MSSFKSYGSGTDNLYVYECEGFHKIGIASSPLRRLEGMQRSIPFRIKMIACFKMKGLKEFKHCRRIEKYIHKHFLLKRVNSEWFKLDQADLESIPFLIKEGSEYYKNNKKFEVTKIELE